MIPAEGSLTDGAAYEFNDEDVEIRQTYWYLLEDVDLSSYGYPARSGEGHAEEEYSKSVAF
ncbi:MAG: hypothetical protein JRJ47_14265 [Deltaproteobacteria bacterium]|nr:hypothetical protein [Deltaproteobacteria bacterium]